MARVERVESTQPVPVEQAQLIDPSAFRFGTYSAEELAIIGGTLEELGKRKIEMQDRIGISTINAAMSNAEREYQKEIIGKPLEEHAAILVKHRNNAMTGAGQIKLSTEARELADNNLGVWADTFTDTGELATIKAIERDAIISVTSDYEKALTEGTPEDIAETELALDEQYKNSYEPGEAKQLKVEAERRAIKQMENNAVNAVHEAIEIASDPETGTGNYEIAKELAKSPSIDGLTKTRLRSAIKTAETARVNSIKDTRQLLIDKTTSDTIREYFGKSLTVAALNERHEKGLIKDSEFKFMMTGLAKKIPDDSDPFAAGRIRRAMVDFEIGAIKRAEADKIVLENYTELDGTDRSNVVVDLEDIETKIIATSKSNAYSEGKSLISPQLIGITTQDEFMAFFDLPGLSDEDKKRLNRRWRAEVNNRNLYERAVDDRFKEMRKEGISDIDRYKSESLKILLQYENRNRYGLEELETVVKREQRKIAPAELIGPPPKKISEMTTKEKRAELARIRELKRLIK